MPVCKVGLPSRVIPVIGLRVVFEVVFQQSEIVAEHDLPFGVFDLKVGKRRNERRIARVQRHVEIERCARVIGVYAGNVCDLFLSAEILIVKIYGKRAFRYDEAHLRRRAA